MTADTGVSGTGRLTFTAAGYATARVTVEIREAPTQPLPSIGLEVVPRVLEIVTEGSTQLSITVLTTATITIAGGDDRASVEATGFTLIGGALNSTQIDVFGVRSGTTTLTIEAIAAGYETTRTTVAVNVIESLRIEAEPDRVDLVAGVGSTQVRVSVSRIEGSEVSVAIAATDGLSVASSVLLTDSNAVTVTVTADTGVSGTGRLTFTAAGYATARVTVEIREAPTQPLPSIGLEVVPRVLEIVTEGSTQLSITVLTTAMITIAGGDDRASVEATGFTLIGGALNSTQIDVFGVRSGTTTLTIEAIAAGYETTRTTVAVNVIESLRIEAEPDRVNLVAGVGSTQMQCERETDRR